MAAGYFPFPRPRSAGAYGTGKSSLAASTWAAALLEWAMCEVLRKPHILAKAANELDRVIGHDRLLVAEGDISSLLCLEAVAKETMRLYPVVPLLVPRVSREGTSVEHFFTGNMRKLDVKGQDLGPLPFGSDCRMCPAHDLRLKMVQLLPGRNTEQGYS